MRILVVCSKYTPEYAGSGLRAHRTYSRLREKYGIEMEVVCSSIVYASWRNVHYKVDGVQVTRISSPWKRRLLLVSTQSQRWRKILWYALSGLDECSRTLWVLIRRGSRFDAVHTFGHCWSAGVVAIWAGLIGKPVVREMVTMQSRPDDPPGLRSLVRWALKRRGIIVAISPLLAERARQLGYKHVWCRPNPVDEQRFQMNRADRAAYRARYTRFGANDIVLLDLSKYAPLKNKELLLRMMPLLPEQYKLVMAGPVDSPGEALVDSLKKIITELGLENRVELQCGFIEHVEHYLQLTDIFLFPSLSDGLGTPVLEAICCGVPVVAHCIPGVTDWWIREGISGALCEPTPQAFADGIKRAMKISSTELDEVARKLYEQASTTRIDEVYYRYLQDGVSLGQFAAKQEQATPILFLDKEGGWGGSSRSLYLLVKYLDRARYTPIVILREEGPVSKKYKDLHIQTHLMPSIPLYKPGQRKNAILFVFYLLRAPWCAWSAWRIFRIVRNQQIKIVHFNHDGFLWLGAFCKYVLRRKVIFHIRTMLWVNIFGKIHAKMLAAVADHLFFITENEFDRFSQLSGSLIKNKYSIVYNIAEQKYEDPIPDWMNRFADNFKVTFLGNLSYAKGVDRLVDVAKSLKSIQKTSSVIFLVCGEERGSWDPRHRHSMLSLLQERIKEESLEEMFYLAGYQDRSEAIIGNSDVVIRTSRFNDPWGRDVIEAITTGKPVIATGSSSVFIEEGVNGFLLDGDFDPQYVAKRIIFLLQNKENYQKIAQANIQKGSQLFDGELNAQKVCEIYDIYSGKTFNGEGSVAIVGAGYWGKNLVRNFHSLRALRIVCDLDHENLKEVHKLYPDVATTNAFDEVLRDPGVKAVVISTPAGLHASMTREALLAGKDVFVEKPLALSHSEGKELVDLAESQDCLLMVGHLLWYHPAVLKLKELIDQGELGRIRYIYSQRLNLGRFRREENILWSFAPHDISVILGFVGEMPESVQAQGGYYLQDKIADVTMTTMSFKSGVRAHVFVSWLHPYKDQRLVVVGEHKMAVFNDMEPEKKLLLYPHSIEWKNDLPIATQKQAKCVQVDLSEPLLKECQHFLECIRTRCRPRTDGHEALRVLKVLGSCQDALAIERQSMESYLKPEVAILDA